MEPATQPPAVPDPRYEALDELQSAALAAQDALSERAGAQARLEAADAAWDAARDRLQQAQERVSGWFGRAPAAETAPERARVVVDEPALAEELADAREDAAVAAALRDDRLGELEDRVAEPHPTADRAATFAAFARDRADAAAGGGPGPRTKQGRILAAIVPRRGDLDVIASLEHTDRSNVTATLHNAGKRGLLTAEMIELLPAAFAKYTGV